MNQRKYLFPQVIELNLAAGLPLGVNIYLIDGGSEYVLLDIGLDNTLDTVIDTIRKMDFPLSKCKYVVATHADADHIQAMAAARERLRTKTAAHAHAAKLIETGELIETYAYISAQNFRIAMPECKIDKKLKDGEKLKVGDVELEVLHTPGHTPGQLSFRLNDVLFSGDNIYKDGCVGVIDAHHGSNIPDFIKSLTRIRDLDVQFLAPSHGPAFRHDKALIQSAIDRLSRYQHMADFGTCAVSWPLQEEYVKTILSGIMPDFSQAK